MWASPVLLLCQHAASSVNQVSTDGGLIAVAMYDSPDFSGAVSLRMLVVRMLMQGMGGGFPGIAFVVLQIVEKFSESNFNMF